MWENGGEKCFSLICFEIGKDNEVKVENLSKKKGKIGTIFVFKVWYVWILDFK